MPETVEAFVEHLIFLSRMANEISSLEHEYHIVTRMYSIERNFEMTISAEELALYQMLMPSFQHLKVMTSLITNLHQFLFRGAGMAHRWKYSPLTAVAYVRFADLASHLGLVFS